MNRFISPLVMTSLLLGALGVHAAESTEAKKPPRSSGCVFSNIINHWQVIDNRTLAVWAPSRKTPYVVTLTRPATSLRFENSIGFEDHNRDGSFCDYGGDSIIVPGGVSDRITVMEIRRVEPDEIQRLIAESKEAREKPKAVLPQPEDMKSEKKD
jgi:Family of unknown function (DUF6491)